MLWSITLGAVSTCTLSWQHAVLEELEESTICHAHVPSAPLWHIFELLYLTDFSCPPLMKDGPEGNWRLPGDASIHGASKLTRVFVSEMAWRQMGRGGLWWMAHHGHHSAPDDQPLCLLLSSNISELSLVQMMKILLRHIACVLLPCCWHCTVWEWVQFLSGSKPTSGSPQRSVMITVYAV